MWLCAIHDLGKATPAFQHCNEVEALRPREAGLTWNETRVAAKFWRHDRLGAVLLRNELKRVWSRRQLSWVWPLVAGHHGEFPTVGNLPTPSGFGEHFGVGDGWRDAQRGLLEMVTESVGFANLKDVEPVERPTRADQLAIAGFVVMADWIASNSTDFPGIDEIDYISLEVSRERAAQAWRRWRLRGGWANLAVPSSTIDLIGKRFNNVARESQFTVVEAAHQIESPGMLLVEAPMGEGKTKAALAASEVLAARFGCDGVLLAMPTQATCTPMFEEVVNWVSTFDPELVDEVQLLHGKRQFNQLWKEIWHNRPSENDVDDFGSIAEDEDFGCSAGSPSSVKDGESRPESWFHGHKRGLLTAFGVATIDQLLFAATRTKHVMLRFAGLAGKVVVIDEVHAADIYMSQFLYEILRWLGQARVPVVLLSATLPQHQRQALCDAYAEGATGRTDSVQLPESFAYPRVSLVWGEGNEARTDVKAADPWRDDFQVAVEVVEDTSDDGGPVVDRVRSDLRGGGTALVVVNSVKRAQRIYETLRDGFEGDTLLLLHGRLDDADRAERTAQSLNAAQADPDRDPTKRQVIVATQVAEQSFNIDADLLITDVAPIDLILQRIGRLHRHPSTPRPDRLREPRVIITGLAWTDTAPDFHSASEAVYSSNLLLRSAALIAETIAGGAVPASWRVPSCVPQLISDGYSDAFVFPDSWCEAAEKAEIEWEADQERRAETAAYFVLSEEAKRGAPCLDGLHHKPTHASEGELHAAVRDGPSSVEVVMVRRSPEGYTAMNGTRLGSNGEVSNEALDDLLGGVVRLPAKFTDEAEAQLTTLPGWEGHTWLGWSKALVLDQNGEADLGGHRLRYDSELGLQEVRGRS